MHRRFDVEHFERIQNRFDYVTPTKLQAIIAQRLLDSCTMCCRELANGAYRIVQLTLDGKRLVVGGVYRELRAPEGIVCTWSWEDDDPALENESLLTLDFIERGENTELVLTHEAFRDATQRDNHEHGWTAILAQLADTIRPA